MISDGRSLCRSFCQGQWKDNEDEENEEKLCLFSLANALSSVYTHFISPDCAPIWAYSSPPVVVSSFRGSVWSSSDHGAQPPIRVLP